jgi:hypothetical protein
LQSKGVGQKFFHNQINKRTTQKKWNKKKQEKKEAKSMVQIQIAIIPFWEFLQRKER